jgi:diaminopropionate ammonia-lyase
MLIANVLPEHGTPLDPADAALLGRDAATAVARDFARLRPDFAPTPLHALPALADEVGVGAVLLKDEGRRLGLGSFKALGGAYAVMRLVLEEAGRRLGRALDAGDLRSPEVRAVAAGMTFACATDGNHGRSVAQGAASVGARAVIFMHGGVSDARVAAIARFGADVVRVAGTYDDSVADAARVSAERGWVTVSDTSWPGYERIAGIVMQGYTTLIREALDTLPDRPTHVFVQAGVGGLAAAVAGHLATVFGADRPTVVVVEPARAACVLASARAGRPVRIDHGAPTVMAMLECYEPSLLAWRILARAADAFMTVDEDDAIAAMNRLARPARDDPAVVSGESGGVGLAGLVRAARDAHARATIGLDGGSRVLLVNTEGATDPARYRELVGLDASEVVTTRRATDREAW